MSERHSENVAWRASGHSPDADRGEQPGAARQVGGRREGGAVEGHQPPRADARAGQDRHRAAVEAAGRRGGARERVLPAPRPVRADRREPHGVGLAGERRPAPGISEPARNSSSAASSSQTANSAQRRRSALSVIAWPRPVPSSRQKRRPLVRAARGGRGPSARIPRAPSSAGSGRGGRRRSAQVEYVLAAMIGYLLGSVPVALLVGRAHGVDLREAGDRNPGAWNALEQLGARRAWPVFAGDAAKAAVAALAGLALGGWWAAWAAVAGAMLGHAFPVFASFRGGKSIMCFVGGGFVLAPAAALCALGAVPRGHLRERVQVGRARRDLRLPRRPARVRPRRAGVGDRRADGDHRRALRARGAQGP